MMEQFGMEGIYTTIGSVVVEEATKIVKVDDINTAIRKNSCIHETMCCIGEK